jgi:hypothetical protein
MVVALPPSVSRRRSTRSPVGLEHAQQARRVLGGKIGQEHRHHLRLLSSEHGESLLGIHVRESDQWIAGSLVLDLIHDLLRARLSETFLKESPSQFETPRAPHIGTTHSFHELSEDL